ncbi:MAG: hypothetical protein RL748_2186 [Pseudomonadota bacterium]|jgi:uncharacterized protein (TIGR02646 family)
MRYLVRGNAPSLLQDSQWLKSKKQWRDVGNDDKAIIWQQLDLMQDGRCAYCERELSVQGKRHIDHFHQRRAWAAGTFAWENLFGSCNDEQCCAKHKDNHAGKYDWQDLLKPDQDNPDDFLEFSSDGTVRPKEGLDPEKRRRAEVTLRVFNLDAERGPLRRMRQQAIVGWLNSLEELRQMDDGSPEMGEVIEKELAQWLTQIEERPFSTAIRHALQQ